MTMCGYTRRGYTCPTLIDAVDIQQSLYLRVKYVFAIVQGGICDPQQISNSDIGLQLSRDVLLRAAGAWIECCCTAGRYWTILDDTGWTHMLQHHRATHPS